MCGGGTIVSNFPDKNMIGATMRCTALAESHGLFTTHGRAHLSGARNGKSDVAMLTVDVNVFSNMTPATCVRPASDAARYLHALA